MIVKDIESIFCIHLSERNLNKFPTFSFARRHFSLAENVSCSVVVSLNLRFKLFQVHIVIYLLLFMLSIIEALH